MRRFLDIFFLILVAPFVVSLIIILSFFKLVLDGRPLFYNSERVGKNGISFRVFKFRTMVNDPEFIKNEIAKLGREGFEAIPLSNVVYTSAGRIFERFQLVEVPQLLNVLKGEMSLIGYRPLPVSHLKTLEKTIDPNLLTDRSMHTPGITGFAQLSGKFNLSNKERIQIEIAEGDFFEKENKLIVFRVYFLLIFITVGYVLGWGNDYAISLRNKILFKK